MHNPDSWEGWYWGAVHHWGYTAHNGGGETYGTVEDCLKNSEMIVFWSADPEATSGVYGAHEGTVRRQWLKELGIKIVHIDPYYNHTAACLGGKWLAPRPGTDSAMALAIAYVWITEELYDKEYVAERTTRLRDSGGTTCLGEEDGIPKTPEWQEGETGVPAKDVRALAREWGKKRTYLAAGGSTASAAPAATRPASVGARHGLPDGDAGSRQAGRQHGQPAVGRAGRHALLSSPAMPKAACPAIWRAPRWSINMYQRMPQLPTMNTRAAAGAAIVDSRGDHGRQVRGLSDRPAQSIEGQFFKFGYPAPGHSPVKIYYKYGGSHFGTMNNTNRYVRMYRSRQSGVRRQPVDLVRGRGQVRRHHPAGLHQLRALGHQRIGKLRRLRPSRLHAVQPPRHRLAAQVHRAARRIEDPTFGSSSKLSKRLGVGY